MLAHTRRVGQEESEGATVTSTRFFFQVKSCEVDFTGNKNNSKCFDSQHYVLGGNTSWGKQKSSTIAQTSRKVGQLGRQHLLWETRSLQHCTDVQTTWFYITGCQQLLCEKRIFNNCTNVQTKRLQQLQRRADNLINLVLHIGHQHFRWETRSLQQLHRGADNLVLHNWVPTITLGNQKSSTTAQTYR